MYPSAEFLWVNPGMGSVVASTRPCSTSAPVGQTVAQCPHETQVDPIIVSASFWNPIRVSSPDPSIRSTPSTWTSLQASTHRLHRMHLLRSIWMKGEESSIGSSSLRSCITP
jgi:hypothetical protein